MTDSSTIDMGTRISLTLKNLGAVTYGANPWTSGTITGSDSSWLNVQGTELTIQQSAGPLGVDVFVGGTGGTTGNAPSPNGGTTGRNGVVTLDKMTSNLVLNGQDNFFQIGSAGQLRLIQQIQNAGDANDEGGIAFDPAHTGTDDIFVNKGGLLYRGAVTTPGVPQQISVAGTIDDNGTVEIGVGAAMLKITGQDSNGVSFLEGDASSNAVLQVDAGANISAAGTYQIVEGTVTLTVTSAGSSDALDGAGLIFGNSYPTFLKLVDSGTSNGTVTVQGPVTLAQNTTTTASFIGSRNTADLLDVHNGTLTLAGKLSLTSTDRQKPTNPLNFLDDSGDSPTINGNFASISDNIDGNDTGQIVPNNPYLVDYQVTIK
jgi:hypothetical protein